MATLEQYNTARTQLNQILEQLSGISAAELVRKDLGADLTFESGLIFFSRTLRLVQSLSVADFEDLSFSKLQQLIVQCSETLTKCRQIQEFSLQKYPSNPISVRDSFITQIRDSYDALFEVVSPVVAFTIRKGTDFARLEEQARQAISIISEESGKQLKALAEDKQSAEHLIDEVRKIAQEAGVSQHAIHFKGEADRHDAAAGRWLIATAIVGGLTVAAGAILFFLYISKLNELTPSQSLQLAISKVVVFSAMLSATFWMGRTYRSHRHNAVVNRHRQNALATFQAFVKAASDDQTKNAVLLQATQCIFSPQQTGYVSGDTEATPASQILEIVRSAGHKP